MGEPLRMIVFTMLGLLLAVVQSVDQELLLDFCVAISPTPVKERKVWETSSEDLPVGLQMADHYDPTKVGFATTTTMTALGLNTSSTTRASTPACKDVKDLTAEDFAFNGLENIGDTSNSFGSMVTPASGTEFPAPHNLGVSAARIDFRKDGVNIFHVHPRASELLYLEEGSLLVGFVDTSNTLRQTTLQQGELFVFPQGLVHFQKEPGYGSATALSFLSSENPGVIKIPNTLFGSTPPIDNDVLEKSFNVGLQDISVLLSAVQPKTLVV